MDKFNSQRNATEDRELEEGSEEIIQSISPRDKKMENAGAPGWLSWRSMRLLISGLWIRAPHRV